MEIHNFDVDDAVKYGVGRAVVLYTLKNWIKYKKRIRKGANKHTDGNTYWFAYASKSALNEQMPYLSESGISKALRELEADGVIISGCFNQNKYDHTKWYSMPEFVLTEEELFDLSEEVLQDGDKVSDDGYFVAIAGEKVDDYTISSDIPFNISSLKSKRTKKKENKLMLEDLDSLPDSFTQKLAEKYCIFPQDVKNCAESAYLWVLSRGKENAYKDWESFLRRWIVRAKEFGNIKSMYLPYKQDTE